MTHFDIPSRPPNVGIHAIEMYFPKRVGPDVQMPSVPLRFGVLILRSAFLRMNLKTLTASAKVNQL